VDSWLWHQVCLELGDVHVQSSVESERCGQRGDDLGDQSVEVGLGRSLNVKVSPADVVNRFIVQHDCYVCVLQQRVSGKN